MQSTWPNCEIQLVTDGLSMTKLKLKSPGIEIKYEGGDKFLKANLLEIHEAFKKSHNDEVRSDLLNLQEELEQYFIILTENFSNGSRLNEELFTAIEELSNKSVKFFEEIKALIDKSGESAQLFQAVDQMQEMQMSFNLQYLMLQNKISQENRQFTMVSNIMKNKHDTAKNSINNIR